MSKVIKSAVIDGTSSREIAVRREIVPPPAQDDYDEEARAILDKAQAEARQLLEKAMLQAENMREDIQRQQDSIFQAAKEKGYQKGYQEGRRAGYQDGLKQGHDAAAETRAEATRVLESAAQERERILNGIEGEAVGLAFAIAEQVMHRQVQVDPEVVMAVARECLNEIKNSRTVFLRANPGETQRLSDHRRELEQHLSEGASLQIVPDKTISPGGCRVETEQGWVHATLEDQTEALKDAIRMSDSDVSVS